MRPAWIGAAAVILALPAPAFNQLAARTPRADQCNDISPSVARDCIGRRIERKERRLAALYPRALAQVRRGHARWGRQDNRLHPRFFEQAQRDWRRYVESNCTSTGAFGGGSNASISDRYTHCYEVEIDRRIELFQQMADGSLGA